MKVRFTRRASADLREIRAYHEQESSAVALRVRQAIISAINLVRLRPAIGIRNIRATEIRSKLVTGFPYRIHYRVRSGALEILHIRHTARQGWPAKRE